jgi:hypothetical protein
LAFDALVWLAVPFQLLIIVPKFHRSFDSLGMKLPYATEAVFSISKWFVDYGQVTAPIFLLAFLALVGGAFICRARGLSPFLLWFLATMSAAILLNVIVVLAIQMPLASLLEGLSK